MKPMLARTVGPKFCHYPCYVQPKLNGVRALYQWRENSGCTWQSRDEKIWFPSVLAHLSRELHALKDVVGDCILDGELYHHGWRLQQINGAVAINRKEPREDTHEVYFHVFDVVDPKRKFSDRWFDIAHLAGLDQSPHIKIVTTNLAHSWHMIEQYFHFWTRQGYEGIMLRPDGPYEFGEHYSERSQGLTQFRSEYLWKHKQWEDGEFVCVGVTQGEGKADIGIGALVCAGHPEDYKNIAVEELGKYRTFKVGTGLTDLDRIEFAANPPTGKLVKVRYLNLTLDGIPFNPSFLAIIQ